MKGKILIILSLMLILTGCGELTANEAEDTSTKNKPSEGVQTKKADPVEWYLFQTL